MFRFSNTNFEQMAGADFVSTAINLEYPEQDLPGHSQVSSCNPGHLPARQTGFAPDVLVETDVGKVAAKDISTDHKVLTREHGYRPVLWVGRMRQQYTSTDNDVPIRFAPSVLGEMERAKGALLAPGQHLLVRHVMNELLFCSPDVLVRASDLAHLTGCSRACRRYAVNWVQLLFDRVEIIQLDGMWVESLIPDMQALRLGGTAAMAAEIEAAVPTLRYEHGLASYTQELPVLNAAEVQVLDLHRS